MKRLVLSLFPGLGLLDRAFEEKGFQIVRGPDRLWGGDVRGFHVPAGVFWGVIGGPPCQFATKLVHLIRAQGHEPRFGNLIPEFERIVAEAAPAWFLMEEVPDTPVPNVAGYKVHVQRLNNRWVMEKDGMGGEQHRLRVFSFGTHNGRRLSIETVALEAPLRLRHETIVSGGGRSAWTREKGTVISSTKVPRSARQFSRPARTVTQSHVDNDPEKKRRDVVGPSQTVTSNVGGKGKGGDGRAYRERAGPPGTVTISDGGKSKRMWRYTVAEALMLQGLPADFLDDAPFTVEGKLKVIANGVPLPMGRALADAVLRAFP